MSKHEELHAAYTEYNNNQSELLRQFNKDYDALKEAQEARLEAINAKYVEDLGKMVDNAYKEAK